LYILGRSDRDRDLQITGLALGQAAMISWSISSFYKALAARKPPEHEGERTTNSDYSKDFRFGLFNRGVFNGWPSGHSMTAFAMAITLVELYPDHETLRYLSWTYAIVVAAGVSTNIHWLSDATSGALMGYSIGKTVGSSFKRLRGQHKSNDGFSLLVIPDGLLLQYRF
jgi:membrane-associated phospholipid phosphatase